MRRFWFFSFLLVFCILSCKGRGRADEIQLPVTAPLSRHIIGYGVISTSYTHVLDRRDDGKSSSGTNVSENALGLLRKGAIVEILERRSVVHDGKAESWVFTAGTYTGWLRENEMRVYASKAQAETAAETMLQ